MAPDLTVMTTATLALLLDVKPQPLPGTRPPIFVRVPPATADLVRVQAADVAALQRDKPQPMRLSRLPGEGPPDLTLRRGAIERVDGDS